MDEIDIVSEGQMEREIMMDQIRMVEIDEMPNYKNFNLKLDKEGDLKINDSDELSHVSSEDSEDVDREEEAEQWATDSKDNCTWNVYLN